MAKRSTELACCIDVGSRSISYGLMFDERQRLKISVEPNMRVVVRAPQGRTLVEVEDRVRRRAPWILKQLAYFKQFIPREATKQFVSGETFIYLGRQYRLKVRSCHTNTVKLRGRFLCVQLNDRTDTAAVSTLVDDWYRTHAAAIFRRRLQVCQETARRYGIDEPLVKVRRMKRRWGSCNGVDSILINTRLVRAPIHCIDYVIMHELAHLKYADHSKAFYRLLGRMMPDWRLRKERLESTAGLLEQC